MQESVEFYKDLQETLSKKIIFLRYEDLALDFMKYGQKVYSFIGMNFTEQLQTAISESINDDNTDRRGSSYTTKRQKTLNQIANPWRLDKLLTVCCGCT